jgi:hypothetical protein
MIGSSQIPLVPEFPNLISMLAVKGRWETRGSGSAPPEFRGHRSPLFSSNQHCGRQVALHDTGAGMHDLRQTGGRVMRPRPDFAGPGGYPPSTAMAVVVPLGCVWSILPIP